ncbi:MAG: TIGR03905 family TSCPD domain-containing protein [Clostridia bacterium]|nr:TIGR03905 family TSCPD domain-containing protein [Clostridia bacterium]MBQ4575276.1 TIGR03905 family TSCPD domain-containing protein [Clostridia bacterium]
MKTIQYKTKGTCSRAIEVTVDENDIVTEVRFIGGCHGNTQGVAKLAVGMKREDVIAKLRGIDCGGKGTSCPDQLARALEQAV